MQFDEFLALDRGAVAALMRKRGDLNAVFWINGTRRWFLAKAHAGDDLQPDTDPGEVYAQRVADKTASAFGLLFEHGVHTIICPAVYASNLLRGDEYVDEYLLRLVEVLCTSPTFQRMMANHGVRGFAYGEMEAQLKGAQRERFRAAVEGIVARTREFGQRRLFVGFSPVDAATAALQAVETLRVAGKPVREISRNDLVQAYYGDGIDRVHLTIAHGRMSYHSTPFLTPGDLYFQVSPSLYLDETGLRRILHDFLFSRPVDDRTYDGVPNAQWADVDTYYEQNRHQVIGLGAPSLDGKMWSIDGADVSEPAVRRRLFGAAPERAICDGVTSTAVEGKPRRRARSPNVAPPLEPVGREI